MMQHRHGFNFKKYSLSMWIPAEEFEAKANLYSHSGEVEQVNRYNISIYDDNYHYTYTVARFVRENESDAFNEVVLLHVPEEIRDSEYFEMERVKGYCIVKHKAPVHERLALGLHGALHDHY